MLQIINIRESKKEHRCTRCGEKIAIGEPYLKERRKIVYSFVAGEVFAGISLSHNLTVITGDVAKYCQRCNK